ncbi:MAG: ROK family transcriptional regulator [Propionibacteriaceae bacterium]|jgi:predicted NBD/HSP70 family sugar kinase|nr:ROK family transcriptional regulator [Propionibacteriaceae bacterium]
MVERPGSTSALRESNTQRVLSEVRASGGLVQAEIARRTGLSPATVTNLVRDLADLGQVKVTDHVHHGRRAKLVEPNVRTGFVLGVDLGRSHVRACLVDMSYQVVGEAFQRVERGTSSDEGLKLVAGLFEKLLAESGVMRSDVLHAGVGIPGPVDQMTGRIGAANLLPEWADIDLPAAFSKALGLPVTVDNDANLGALGEYAWPPTLREPAIFYMRLATGIGGGLIQDGQLVRGADGTAGEIGHHSIDESGPLCRCGNRGCLEAIASVPDFLHVLSSAVGGDVDVDRWVELTRRGHTTAVRLMEDLARHIGVAVGNIVNIANPNTVIIGGAISVVGEILLEPLRAEVRQRALPAATRSTRITQARWGDYAEVYGAAYLAMAAVDWAPPCVQVLNHE